MFDRANVCSVYEYGLRYVRVRNRWPFIDNRRYTTSVYWRATDYVIRRHVAVCVWGVFFFCPTLKPFDGLADSFRTKIRRLFRYKRFGRPVWRRETITADDHRRKNGSIALQPALNTNVRTLCVVLPTKTPYGDDFD